MLNPPPAASLYRLHFVLVVVYNVYAMCVLFWHFRRYVIIRQTYLTRGAGARGVVEVEGLFWSHGWHGAQVDRLLPPTSTPQV